MVCPLCGCPDLTSFLEAPDRFHWRQKVYQLRRCSGCSCVWTANPPPPEEIMFHYGDDYHRAITAGGEDNAETRWRAPRRIIERYKQAGSILDIGCSTGGFLKTMKGWDLHGIELDPRTAERARLNVRGEIFAGNALSAPFASESFDVVTCFDVLEHVYEPRQLLSRVATWLKPDGIFYVFLPNVASWESRLFQSYWYGLELPRHLFHFSPPALRYLMRSAGMEEVSLATKACYVEPSTAYLVASLIEALGFAPLPLASAPKRGIVWKAVRKCIRAAILMPFATIAATAGGGASIEALFRRPGAP